MAARRILTAIALLLLSSGLALAASVEKKKKADVGAEFFQDAKVRVFDFKVPEADLAQLVQSSRTYVSAQITEGEHVLEKVGIRLKGMGSFRPVDEKPSFTVKFDEFVENQTYRGLKKAMFNNSSQDLTCLAELLATQLFDSRHAAASVRGPGILFPRARWQVSFPCQQSACSNR